MADCHLIYASQPFGFDTSTLNGILINARANNLRVGLTGSLICRADMYLQMLEGPEEAVEATYARILKDDRHVEARKLVSGPIQKRMFGDWAMRDDPVRTWMWTREEVAAGAIDKASEAEVLAIFTRLSLEVP